MYLETCIHILLCIQVKTDAKGADKATQDKLKELKRENAQLNTRVKQLESAQSRPSTAAAGHSLDDVIIKLTYWIWFFFKCPIVTNYKSTKRQVLTMAVGQGDHYSIDSHYPWVLTSGLIY